jgi:hypothetical protein
MQAFFALEISILDLGFHSSRFVFLLRRGQLFLYGKLHWWDGVWDKLDIHVGSMCLRCMEGICQTDRVLIDSYRMKGNCLLVSALK